MNVWHFTDSIALVCPPPGTSSHQSPLLRLHPQLLPLSPLLSTPLVSPVLVPTVAWQVTGNANNGGCGSPCSAKRKPHDKLPSSVCFANSPHRSPPRPVVTFCCILYMQIPANQLACCSPLLAALPIVIKMNWLWAKINTGQPAKRPGVNGTQQKKWGGKIEVMLLFLHSSLASLHFILYHHLITAGIKHSEICWKWENGTVNRPSNKLRKAVTAFWRSGWYVTEKRWWQQYFPEALELSKQTHVSSLRASVFFYLFYMRVSAREDHVHAQGR